MWKKHTYRARYIYQLNEELLIGPETGGWPNTIWKPNVFLQIIPICENFWPLFTLSLSLSKYWWLTTNEGLIQADARNQKIIEIWNQDDGLSDRVIYTVLEDLNGNIWVKAQTENNMINPQTKTVNKYNEADGLQGLNLIRQLVPMIPKAI